MLKAKNKKINKLLRELDEARANLDDLKKSMKELINNNRELESVVREMLEEKKSPNFDLEKDNLLRENKTIKN